MNAATHTELAAVAATQSAVDAMAVVTLSPEKYAAEVYQPFKAKLADAIDSLRTISYDITTTAGMAIAVKCRALPRDIRIAANKERAARKEPITKIGKLLESGFDQIEERTTPLEDFFDADIQAEIERKEAEKAAKILAERQRTEAIQADIQNLRDMALRVAGQNSVLINAAIEILEEIDATEARFAEFAPDAAKAISETIDKLVAMLESAKASEASALAAEQSRIAEAARLEAERVENARQRAENERIANEQAAERQRLADLAAAQALAAKQLADKAAANLKADRDAQELAMRLQREALAEAQRKANEEIRAGQAKLAAEQAAHDAAIAQQQADIQREADHAEALADNATFDAAMARLAAVDTPVLYAEPADLARCNGMVDTLLTDARTASVEAYEASGLADRSEGRMDDLADVVLDLLRMGCTAVEIRAAVDLALVAEVA